MNDFTPLHDEIRFVNQDLMIGKYTTFIQPGLMNLFGPNSLGIFHTETSEGGGTQFSFYYMLRRSLGDDPPAVGFLRPLLDVRLPEGVGMSFDEEMSGGFYQEFKAPAGREGDLQIEAQDSLDGAGGL